MKTVRFILSLAILFNTFTLLAQGSGKVTLKAEIETSDENNDLQISVIDLASKDLIQRDMVSSLFLCTLPLNKKFMIHFRKEGHPTTRMIIDTTAPEEMCYFVNLALKLNQTGADLETGISQSAGKIGYNTETGSFDLSQDGASGASLLSLTYVSKAPTLVKF